MRYGIAWRKGAEEVVARFVEYVKLQFKAK
jgi:hypothetical protein